MHRWNNANLAKFVLNKTGLYIYLLQILQTFDKSEVVSYFIAYNKFSTMIFCLSIAGTLASLLKMHEIWLKA